MKLLPLQWRDFYIKSISYGFFINLITIISGVQQPAPVSQALSDSVPSTLFLVLLLLGVHVHCIANGDGVEEEAGRWRHIQLADQISIVHGGKIESWTSFTS